MNTSSAPFLWLNSLRLGWQCVGHSKQCVLRILYNTINQRLTENLKAGRGFSIRATSLATSAEYDSVISVLSTVTPNQVGLGASTVKLVPSLTVNANKIPPI